MIQKQILMEVGMSDGFDTARILQRFGNKFELHGFEPVPAMFEHTSKRFADNPNVHVNPHAVDLVNGTANFNLSLSDPEAKFTDGTGRKIHPYGCSSLFEFADDIHEKWKGRPDFNVQERIEVQTTRLDTYLDNVEFDAIAFIHVDAQGNDINVLKSMGTYLKRVKSGVIEVAAQTQLYKGTNNTLANAKQFLRGEGFYVTMGNVDGHEADVYFQRNVV